MFVVGVVAGLKGPSILWFISLRPPFGGGPRLVRCVRILGATLNAVLLVAQAAAQLLSSDNLLASGQ